MQLENCRSFVESISKRFLFTPFQPANFTEKPRKRNIFNILHIFKNIGVATYTE